MVELMIKQIFSFQQEVSDRKSDCLLSTPYHFLFLLVGLLVAWLVGRGFLGKGFFYINISTEYI